MAPLINQIHKFLLKKHKTIAVAESCTGGLCSYPLTGLSGRSKYFSLGIVAYSNLVKKNILKVPAAIMAKNGAVSHQVASLMAKNIRKIEKSNFGIGLTGIAGPTGGTPQKPVGTVFIAINSQNRNICKEFHFKGSRNTIRKEAALEAIRLLKNII